MLYSVVTISSFRFDLLPFVGKARLFKAFKLSESVKALNKGLINVSNQLNLFGICQKLSNNSRETENVGFLKNKLLRKLKSSNTSKKSNKKSKYCTCN